MQFKKIAFLIISATIIFTGCDSKKENQDNVKKEIIKKQSIIQLTTNDAKTLNLEKTDNGIIFEELKGKVVLLNFFATWCPPCQAEIPNLVSLKNKYKDDFEVVAVNVGDKQGVLSSSDNINSFIKENKINYIVTNTEQNFKLSNIVGKIKSIPTMFMFDKSGKLVQKYVGIVPEEMMESDIKKALGK